MKGSWYIKSIKWSHKDFSKKRLYLQLSILDEASIQHIFMEAYFYNFKAFPVFPPLVHSFRNAFCRHSLQRLLKLLRSNYVCIAHDWGAFDYIWLFAHICEKWNIIALFHFIKLCYIKLQSLVIMTNVLNW